MKLSKTEALLKKMREDAVFDSYAVLVGLNGERTLFLSDDTDGDTYFDVASMGKVLVTSTLILKAVGRGMLTLDTTLGDFFEISDETKKNITIRQMLTHSSGIVRVGIPDRIADSGKAVVAEFILRQPLLFTPGSGMVYSCNAYILLGYILEKLFGMELDEIYERELVRPLGLTRSRFNVPLDEPNAATCYCREFAGCRRADDENAYTLGGVAGNGASFTSVTDLETFIQAVLSKSERLYPRELFGLAETDYTPEASAGRGLGYLVVDSRYHQTGRLFPAGSFGHCGHSGQSFFINRETGLYVIILTNATRCLNRKNRFAGYRYEEIMAMREKIHDTIWNDLNKEKEL